MMVLKDSRATRLHATETIQLGRVPEVYTSLQRQTSLLAQIRFFRLETQAFIMFIRYAR